VGDTESNSAQLTKFAEKTLTRNYVSV